MAEETSDHLERLRECLDAHRPDPERKSGDIIATLPNPEGRGWRHLTGDDLRAALDELEQLRAELDKCQAQLAETSADGAQWQSRAETAERELAEMRAVDDENIGTEIRPLTKRELRDIGMAVVGPLKHVPERWDHETVARLYWALMQQRGEAIMARRELAELRERIGETPGLGGYTIGCDGDDATQWPYVECNRCRHDVWTGRYTGSALNLADAVDQVAAHNCDKAAKLRNIITEGG